MKILFLLFVLGLTGCATGKSFAKVKPGMYYDEVRKIMGAADDAQGSITTGMTLMYKDRLVANHSDQRTDFYVFIAPSGIATKLWYKDVVVDDIRHSTVDIASSFGKPKDELFQNKTECSTVINPDKTRTTICEKK